MNKKPARLILILCISIAALGAVASGKNLLRDGFILAGVDGKLTGPDVNDRWFFEFDSDLNNPRGLVKIRTSIELLPSAALEKMTADAKKYFTSNYRLWGTVTKYRDRNFIFGIYFSAISKIDPSKPPTSPQPEMTINEPNDELAIPKEIIDKLTVRKIIRPAQLRKGLELKQDFILTDRIGFISSHDFVPDALGRNVERISFLLLPCKALERAQLVQSTEPNPIRFKTAGIVTQYKGRNYLLLQKATRVYNYGNFRN